jgi:hypothetical protein
MSDTRSTLRTAHFYEWEQRGRGWLLAEYPVQLEPPYYPFFSHKIQSPYIDDGRHPTLLSTIADLFRPIRQEPHITQYEPEPIEPFPYKTEPNIHTIGISFQRGFQVKIDRMEQLLVMLSQHVRHLSFEIIATHTTISIQLACHDKDNVLVRTQLQAYFPEAILHEYEDALQILDNAITLVDFGLQEEFMRPLTMVSGFESDPFISLFGFLEHLGKDEQVVIQVLFAGSVNSWGDSIMRSVTIDGKESFFIDAPEMPSLANEKLSRPLYGVCIRAFAQAANLARTHTILENVSTALITASASKHNSLIPLANPDYDADTRINDMLLRQSHRLGMLLNVRELATFVHFPSAAIRSLKLVRTISTTKLAPDENALGDYVLGINHHHSTSRIVFLSEAQRLQHMHIIGVTGMGKSTLLLTLMQQDIHNGNGFAVLDPHGDLIESLLQYIPKKRIKDVVLIDPSDSDFPIGFNLLQAHSDLEKELLSSDLVALFRRFSTSWGDQMNSVLANAILAFLESTKGGTLVDLRRFLIEKPYRDQFLTTVTDPQIVYYWQREYPLIKSSSIGPILTRLDTFLRPKLIRNMVSQKRSLDMEQLMDSKKIILVKLSQGLIGAENSFLLGACIVSKIQQAAMARQAKTKDARTSFFLYIDEFHHFITPSMATILTGTRKYGVGLILAHQDMQQVSKYDSELSGAIMGTGTRICFRLGDNDAKKFEDGFSLFTKEDLLNLDTGETITRIGRSEHDFNMRITPLPPEAIQGLQEEVIAASRNTYGTPKETIEPLVTPTESKEGEYIPFEEAVPKPTKPPLTPPSAPSVVIEKDTQELQKTIDRKERSHHRYLQTLIKKMGEDRGYKASIEMPTPDGSGKVDVLLEKDGKTIAVEISVTTTAKWEIHNMQKCLAARYDMVIACTDNQSTSKQMQQLILDSFSDVEKKKIKVVEPDFLFAFIDSQCAPPEPTEERIKGYRVKVSYESLSHEEQKQKSASVSRIVREALNTRK